MSKHKNAAHTEKLKNERKNYQAYLRWDESATPDRQKWIDCVKFGAKQAFAEASTIEAQSCCSVKFPYPHILAVNALMPLMNKRAHEALVISERLVRRAFLPPDLDTTYKWVTTDIQLMNEVFFDEFHPRVWYDIELEDCEDSETEGMQGGMLRPIIDEYRVASVTYYWNKQIIQIDFFLEKWSHMLDLKSKGSMMSKQ